MTESHPRSLDLSTAQTRVEEIWRDVLHMPEGRADLTFFDLQGQSISAVRIIARIEDELGVAVDIGILFEDPDLTTFAGEVVTAVQGAQKGAESEVA